MKVKILAVVLAFSLAFNAAALVSYLLLQPVAGCPVRSLAGAEEKQLGLTLGQREEFARLDAIYHQQRSAASGRLRELRRKMLDQVLDERADQRGLEEVLARVSEEQIALQRHLLENLRAKVLLLDAGQREAYRKVIENLAGGCGCVGCTGTCH